jgi:hypothetical protein
MAERKKACSNDAKEPAVNVRHAPESDRLLRGSEMTRWANSDILRSENPVEHTTLTISC